MAPVESPHVVSYVNLHILKKGKYTLWSMRMEQYLKNTNYALWQVIMNGDEPVQTTKDENGVETKVPPKTAQDAKTLWVAIKSRFGGNVESKKMQKNALKQQFENFSVSNIEGLDKAYDRFQKLISLLEVHGEAVSNEDANQKFLRALPSSWNNVALIMRNKTGIDDLDIDDLYNNLKVFEADIKSSSGSSSNSQNVAFLSAEDTNSINKVNTANCVSTASGQKGPTTNKTRASISNGEESITSPSSTSVEMPRVESVRPSGVIIEDWVSDDDDDIFQSNDSQTIVKPGFKKIKFTKPRTEPVKSDKQAVKLRMVTQS
ncbi:hypothetical protein Tco_1471448, partial [Tanacetum coccineum]